MSYFCRDKSARVERRHLGATPWVAPVSCPCVSTLPCVRAYASPCSLAFRGWPMCALRGACLTLLSLLPAMAGTPVLVKVLLVVGHPCSSLASALQRDFDVWFAGINVPLLLAVGGNVKVLALMSSFGKHFLLKSTERGRVIRQSDGVRYTSACSFMGYGLYLPMYPDCFGVVTSMLTGVLPVTGAHTAGFWVHSVQN